MIRAGSEPACYRAKWIMIDPDQIVEDACLVTGNGRVVSVYAGPPPRGIPVIDFEETILMPGLVNAHTHLELSAVREPISADGGFGTWVQRLISVRDRWTDADISAGISSGIKALTAGGTAAAGDVTTLGVTRDPLAASELPATVFHEFLGPDRVLEKNLSGCALAGHAPHTTDPLFLIRLKKQSIEQKTPFSLHLAESDVEGRFIRDAHPGWRDFLVSRGIDPGTWPLPSRSPVRYAHDLGLLDPDTLAVHLIDVDAADAVLLADSGSFGCICVRSNRYLHGRIPDLPLLLKAGVRLCIGTDSLASTPTLSMRDELNALVSVWPDIPSRTWLAMATVNGAAAIGLSAVVGSLAPGHAAVFLPLHLQPGGGTPEAHVLNALIG